ncbi:MAG: DNA mismatch repair protein MutS [Alphaproteobacteria bacterium]|nr:DNA mismatch repair protein MutS [Alphaproteobacteria bacterium]
MSEKNNIPPGMEQYLQIKKDYSDYVLFYRMGDFYELFFDDAITASPIMGIALTKRGKVNGENVPLCGVPYHAYEQYMAKLIKAGYKVAICEQMENPEEARKRGYKSVVRRDVIRLVTPGTLTEDTLLDARKNNYLLCLCKTATTYGLAWLDLSTGEFYTKTMSVTSKNEAAEVWSVLSQLQPAEVMVSDAMLQNPELFQILNEYKEKLSVLPQARFNYANAYKAVAAFYEVASLDSFGDFEKPEITAAGMVLDYVENTQKGKIPRIARPLKIRDSLYMEIDAATRHNLDLLDGPHGSSLIAVMDRTVTGAGARMMAQRISAPLVDLAMINARLDALEFFYKHNEVRQNLRSVLKECPDLERSVSRLSVGRGGPRDLKAIWQTLNALPRVRQSIKMYHRTDVVDELPPAVEAILNRFGNHCTLEDKLGRALLNSPRKDGDLPYLARDGDFISDGFNADLDAVRTLRDRGEDMMKGLEDKYKQQTQIDHLKIKYNNVIGYFVEIPSKFATQLLSDTSFIHRQSVLNAARFTTSELTDLENKIRGAKEKALALELAIFDDLVHDILFSADDISRTASALAELDVSAALADLALENNYCRPKLDDGLAFEVEEGRHPIVEAAMRKNNDGTFVGNACNLNSEDNRIWLITGPNMAGKSTFLRQNALIAIMAQSGSFVPAKSAHIGLVNKVFSRVGASDDLSRGRSTFMVEMVETASILNRADERSFVILDEIGRGTATFDGLSIAWAVVEYLHEVNKSRALFATHYHELAVLAQKLSAMTLHCMKIKEFNEQVIFLHEVIEGAADRSYGIHVAKLAGLPKSVITRSEQVLKKLEKENQKKTTLDLTDELPLFSFAEEQMEESAEKISAVEAALAEVDPDNLTAREALEKLYELKELLKGTNNGS